MTKKEIKQLSEKLLARPKLVWDRLSAQERRDCFTMAEDYKAFLSKAKTERQAVAEIINMATEKGFKNIDLCSEGKRFYKVAQNKTIALAVLGEKPPQQGVALIASHIDCPRLDLKQNPLYEEVELAMFKTHYYGGIKKYQWVTRPLAIHGRIIKGDGQAIDIRLGEDIYDPVFVVCDLLPHLARKVQSDKKMSEAIPGEKLNILAGGIPFEDEDTKERFKLELLRVLNERYGLVEEDLISAELEVVPAGPAKDVGWDRSFVGAYGQDDRACAFHSLQAILEMDTPARTVVAHFADKEEIGSAGATGADSLFLENFTAELIQITSPRTPHLEVLRGLSRSRALSADVNAGLDPDYQEVHEKRNAARIGYGICLSKFGGSGGKYDSSDADVDYLGWLRLMFNKHDVAWQAGELGKVDEGGGGTVAKHMARYGMDIIDCGPPLLSMHSPFEIAHKGDLYMTYRAFKTFFSSDWD
ncbi:MAG: aminopeptidase [Deltaproteobacteria bacterium]|nr:aminopeptidase [Deltaproteobacteria bacterium]